MTSEVEKQLKHDIIDLVFKHAGADESLSKEDTASAVLVLIGLLAAMFTQINDDDDEIRDAIGKAVDYAIDAYRKNDQVRALFPSMRRIQ